MEQKESLDPELLKILVCPEDKTSLQLGDRSTVDQLNGQIASGTLQKRSGEKITELVDGVLIRTDHQRIYPIRKGIPILLVDEGIDLGQNSPITISPNKYSTVDRTQA